MLDPRLRRVRPAQSDREVAVGGGPERAVAEDLGHALEAADQPLAADRGLAQPLDGVAGMLAHQGGFQGLDRGVLAEVEIEQGMADLLRGVRGLVDRAAFELDGEIGGALGEEIFAGGVGSVVVGPVVEAVLEEGGIFVRQDDGLGAEAVFEGVEPGPGFPFRGSWSGRASRVFAIDFAPLFLGEHQKTPFKEEAWGPSR